MRRLLKSDGSLIAYAGVADKEGKVCSAIASSVWAAYQAHQQTLLGGTALHEVLVECEVRPQKDIGGKKEMTKKKGRRKR